MSELLLSVRLALRNDDWETLYGKLGKIRKGGIYRIFIRVKGVVGSRRDRCGSHYFHWYIYFSRFW